MALVLAGSTAAAAEPDRPPNRWDDYQLLMWQDQDVAGMAGLARMGFSGVKLRGTGGSINPADIAARQQAGLPWWVENVATDFYASYHVYTQGKSVTWRFDAVRERRQAAPDDLAVFLREPGLSDPAALAALQSRLTGLVRRLSPENPLFYNLGDESGIADLSAAWDFDLSPASLAGMRRWLQTQYADLEALNRQWGTSYASWEDVQPELTDAAMRRTDDNYSAWADFKAWMDVAFSTALRAGTDAVHAGDPAALAGIEGAQVPGWGGYDYGRLAGAVDVMEIYDSGDNLVVAHSLNPALIPLRTVFETGPRATHVAWRDLMRGGRGTVVWDELNDTVTLDGKPGPRGTALAALTASLRVVAPAVIASQPAPSAVAVLYSQASFRTRWMLDQRPRGVAWSDRDAERELDDNAWRAARRQVTNRLGELGIQPRWLSSQLIEGGALDDPSLRVLMLPHAIALSDAEVAAIARFAGRGNLVLADTEPGVFDGHSRRRSASPLAGVALMPQVVRPDAEPSTSGTLTGLAVLLAKAGATPGLVMTGPDGHRASGVDAHLFRNGAVTLVSLQAATPWGAPAVVGLTLPTPGFVYDMRRGGPPRQAGQFNVALDAIEPSVFAVSPTALPGPTLSGPDRAQPSGRATWRIGLDGQTPAAVHAMRVDLLDASGARVPASSGVLRVGTAGAEWSVTLPADATSQWTLRVRDTLGGGTVSAPLSLEPR